MKIIKLINIILLSSFTLPLLASQCEEYLYYLPSNGRFISSSDKLEFGVLSETTVRECAVGESPDVNHKDFTSYKKVEKFIISASEKYKIEKALIAAIIQVESGYRVNAVSSKKAKGLMQLIDSTSSKYGVSDPFDPEENITAGVAHISYLMGVFDGDVKLSLAAYNAGENAIIKYNGIPPFKETNDYVSKVLYYYDLIKKEK